MSRNLHRTPAAPAAWRPDVVPRQTSGDGRETELRESAIEQAREPDPAETARRPARGRCWASLRERTFGFDVLACPRCGQLIEEAAVIGRILGHLDVPTEIPAPPPARAPPPWVGVREAGCLGR